MRYLYTQQKGQPAKDTSVRGLTGVRKPARKRAAFLRALRSATCVAALFLVAGAAALAQSRTVTGKVGAQDDGSGIPGVNVLVKGTTTGAITDANGSYSVSVPGDDATLVFSFIGYITQEVPVGSRSTVDVQMAADVKALEEVVVTGYTTQQK
jgi:hypothetical protein